MQKKKCVVVLVQKVKASCALASENKDSYLLRRDTIWGCMQWKIACCSSWTSSSASHKSHKSQVGEDLGFHIAVSKRRVWTRILKRATLRMTFLGRSRNIYLGERVARTFFGGSAHYLL